MYEPTTPFNSLRIRSSVIIVWLVLLSGCSFYELNKQIEPSVSASAEYSIRPNGSNSKPQQKITPWWYSFQRSELNALVENALASNFELRQGLARIQQARAIQQQTNSGLFPQLDFEARKSDEWEGSDAQRGVTRIGLALEWEIDAFNRVRAAAMADELEIQARVEDVEALRLSLIADVANAYFGAIAAHRTLNLLGQQLDTDQQLLSLLKLRFEYGVGTNVDVLQQQSRVADSASLIPTAEADLRIFENRLDVLLGRAPDGINRVSPQESLQFTRELPAVGVPANLLFNRPDLRAARLSLLAADADIGAAIANRLPRITLEGAYVYSDSSSFTGPLSTILTSFVQPLLDWGRRKAEVKRNRALYVEQLARFSQAYLEAIETVENALYQEHRQREFIQRLESRRDILQQTVEETEARYTEGVDDYLPVLSALQELRDLERDLIDERLQLVNFRIRLHRAIGGSMAPNDPSLQENTK